ncbi:MAG TPA: head GIN domain-containing protein [Candidatus Kapabacteria bacterium]|nr:head GIN domain-containing protein [Candidatus Kapabacteria bacterium]
MQHRAIIFFPIVLIALCSCHRMWPIEKSIAGNGNTITEDRQIGTFTGIDLEGNYEVTLTQGPVSSLRIVTDSNLLAYIKSSIEGGKLVLTSEANLQPTKSTQVYISSPNYTSIEIQGSAEVHGATPIKSDDLTFNIAGSGSADLEIHAQKLKTDVEGSGKLTLKGDALTYTADLAGSGSVDAVAMPVETAKIDIAGSGDADVFVAKRLDADIAGSGNIRYKGSVNDVHTSIAGSGKVEKLEGDSK